MKVRFNIGIVVILMAVCGGCAEEGSDPLGASADAGSTVAGDFRGSFAGSQGQTDASSGFDRSSDSALASDTEVPVGDVSVDVVDSSTSTVSDTSASLDAGGDDVVPDTQDLPQPPSGPTCLRITTEDSPSWVSWFEVEVSASKEAGGEVWDNVALNAPVVASGSDGDSVPENAVDGDASTNWNAGDFAPSWLEVELGEIDTLVEVRLLVAQVPPGPTVHRVEVSQGCEVYETLHVFEEETQAGQWLVFNTGDTPDTPPVTNDPPSSFPRGLSWVRNNPMFLSGLVVSVTPPTEAQATEYFDGFGASAAHFWATGLPTRLEQWRAASSSDMPWVSWVDDFGRSPVNDLVIGGLPANPPGRIGYQVGDEPGLNGNGMEELLALEIGVDTVRQADPDALIIMNFSFWADELPAMLDYYGASMDGDVFAYDRYEMRYKEHETLRDIREAALLYDKPYWRYIRSYHDWDKAPENHTEVDYRWHAFVGMVYGYTGYTWFVYQVTAPHLVSSDFYPAQGGLEQQKTERWQWAAQLNTELRHMGRTITQLTSTDVRYVPGQSLYLPDGLVEWTPGAGEDPYLTGIDMTQGGLLDVRDLALGFFEDDEGEHYVMVQNQQHPAADFPIDNTEDISFTLSFDFGGGPASLDANALLALNHKTGAFYELPLTSTGSATASLQHTLPAGEPLLFKYKTGVPFAVGPN